MYFEDNEAPNIKCSEYLSIPTDKGKPTAKVNLKGATASDNSGNVPRVSCNPQLGTNFHIGHTTVTCEALDGSGNRAECSFQFRVIGTMFVFCLFLSEILTLIKYRKWCEIGYL